MQSGPHPLARVSAAQVVVRFVLRSAVMVCLAAFSSHGFGRVCVLLFAVCALFCAIIGSVRREPIFGPTLTHWDEGVAYAALSFLALSAISRAQE